MTRNGMHETSNNSLYKEFLRGFLEGEPVGSPKWLRIADHFALSRAEARIAVLSRYNLGSVPMQLAIAEWSRINETVRNRSIGPDAVAYNQVDVGPIYNTYYPVYAANDQENFYPPETTIAIADAVLTDLGDIIMNQGQPTQMPRP